MTYKLVEKKNHLAVHGLFDSGDRADRHLKETIPVYVAKSYFMDKTLTADSFEIVEVTSEKTNGKAVREEITMKQIMLDMVLKRNRRDYSKLPASFEFDAVCAAFQDVKGFFPKHAIKQRIKASKAQTFAELNGAIESI